MRESDLIFKLLDISKDVPLTEIEMAESMAVTFHPEHQRTERLDAFAQNLKSNLIDIGVEVLPFKDALNEKGKIRPGIVIFEQGEGNNKDLAIKKVSTLYHNPIVGILEGKLPIPDQPNLQETLDSIVSVLAWNLVHIPLFVQKNDWTICTMNGSVIDCKNWKSSTNDILHSLIPKLSAQVVPPKREKIVYRKNKFDAQKEGYNNFIEDFMSAAKIWHDNGLMLAHTSIEDLTYRNRFYKRVVSQFLDHRTGMSYGFLVKQLPADVEPAIEISSAPNFLKSYDWDRSPIAEHNGDFYAKFQRLDTEWFVKIPDVWLLSTRSGCNKTNLNPRKDILKLGLHNGNITIETPADGGEDTCRPSYDTYAIIAHAVGNIVVASIIMATDSNSDFPSILKKNGLSISHWHGYPNNKYPLPGYAIHGEENPPVSCSTPQSAAYAFMGKLNSLDLSKHSLEDYRGDIHIEPHHGTNISGSMTLTETANWVDKMHKHRATVSQKIQTD